MFDMITSDRYQQLSVLPVCHSDNNGDDTTQLESPNSAYQSFMNAHGNIMAFISDLFTDSLIDV